MKHHTFFSDRCQWQAYLWIPLSPSPPRQVPDFGRGGRPQAQPRAISVKFSSSNEDFFSVGISQRCRGDLWYIDGTTDHDEGVNSVGCVHISMYEMYTIELSVRIAKERICFDLSIGKRYYVRKQMILCGWLFLSYAPLENFPLIWRRHREPTKAFSPCLGLTCHTY